MIHTDDIYVDSILLRETPEEYFQNRMQLQPGVPFPVNPNEELQEKFNFIRDQLSQQPTGVDADFFIMFYRDPELLRSIEGEPEKDYWFSLFHKHKAIGSFKLDLLEDSLDRVNEQHPEKIQSDSYFTVNNYFRANQWNVPDTGYPYPARKEENLAILNACYADIDIGRFFEDDAQYKAFTRWSSYYSLVYNKYPNEQDLKSFLESYHWEQALLQVLILEREELIPEVSIFARSGRGIYLFWVIEPTRAFDEEIFDYKNINKFLNRELRKYLPGDKNAVDAARYLRIHGATHSKSGTQVCYYPSIPSEISRIYTIDELKAFCNLNYPKKEISREKRIFKEAKERGSAPARARGVIATAENRIADFIKIQEEQGGINHGIRYTSLSYLIRFMRIAKFDNECIMDIANQVAENCNPPYPCEEEENDIPVADIIKREFAGKNKALKFNNETLAKLWGVEKAMAERLNLKSIKPAGAEYKPPKSSHKKKVSNRKDAIIAIYQKYPDCTPTKCLTLLEKQYGIETSKSTVKREIKQLSSDGLITVVQRSAGRPTRKSTPS